MMTHEEAQELLAVHALNAVEGLERSELEDHVNECVRCSSELDALRAVASAMGNVGAPAPQEIWQRISAHLHDEVGASDVAPIRTLDLPVATITALPDRRGQRSKFTVAAIAVAAAALVGVLSVSLVRADNHVAQLNSALSAASHSVVDAALETPGHVNVTLNGGHSEGLARFVLLEGRGYLVSSNMTALAPDKTYQLWGIIGGKPISIGLMGTKPTTVYFSVEGAKAPSELAITIEPAGGSVTPTSPIVASGRVTA